VLCQQGAVPAGQRVRVGGGEQFVAPVTEDDAQVVGGIRDEAFRVDEGVARFGAGARGEDPEGVAGVGIAVHDDVRGRVVGGCSALGAAHGRVERLPRGGAVVLVPRLLDERAEVLGLGRRRFGRGQPGLAEQAGEDGDRLLGREVQFRAERFEEECVVVVGQQADVAATVGGGDRADLARGALSRQDEFEDDVLAACRAGSGGVRRAAAGERAAEGEVPGGGHLDQAVREGRQPALPRFAQVHGLLPNHVRYLDHPSMIEVRPRSGQRITAWWPVRRGCRVPRR
jgi:hypothetical protein